MLLHRGTKSGFAAPVTLASRWPGVSTIASVGDVTGDGRADVLARTTDGKLVTYAGNGKDSLTRDATLPVHSPVRDSPCEEQRERSELQPLRRAVSVRMSG